MSPSEDLSTSTYAIVSERAELDSSGAEWALDTFLGTVRVRSESERPVFVGIARGAAVERYLGRVERDAVSDFDGDPRYERERGEAPQGPARRPDVLGRERPPERESRRSSGSPRTASGRSC